MEKSFKFHVRMGNKFRIERIIRSVEDVLLAMEAVQRNLEKHQVMGAVLSWKWDGLQCKYWVGDPSSYPEVQTQITAALLIHLQEMEIPDLSGIERQIENLKNADTTTHPQVQEGMFIAAEVYPIKWRLNSAIEGLEMGNLDEVRYYLSEMDRELKLAMQRKNPLYPSAHGAQVTGMVHRTSAYPESTMADDIQEHASEIWVETEDLLTVCHLFQQSVLRTREQWDFNAAVEVALEPVLDTQEFFDRSIRKLRDHGKAIYQLLDA